MSILSRLLYENTVPTEKGYRERKEPHFDRVISAVDPERPGKEMGIQLVSPPHPKTISQELASGRFTYDP